MAESPQTDEAPEDAKPEKPATGKEETLTARDDELSENPDFDEDLAKLRDKVEKAFMDQMSRTTDQCDYWDIYDCVLNDNQAYNGNAQAYIALVADAIDARKTRFANQLFPLNGRYVEVITMSEDLPHAEMALIEHYVSKLNLKSNIITPLLKNGDIEGQYTIYVGWSETERNVASKKFRDTDGVEVESVEEEVIIDSYPDVEVIPDSDIVIVPATSDSIEKAIAGGGCVAITRRWSNMKIDEMVEAGEIAKDMADSISADMNAAAKQSKDMKKEHVNAAGIKEKGSWYLAREVWHTLEVDGVKRICRSYFGADEHKFLGTKLNPYWCDRVPVFSCPVEKVAGSAKGVSPLKRVAALQYLANDFLNQAADSATYAMLPIVMTDPAKNPRVSTMILDLAAVWEVDPKSTQFANFPHLWEQGFELISALKAQIQQSLGVNPSMIPATSGKSKRSQADIANEQAVDLLTTAEAVSVIESGILTPAIEFIVELDKQFRHEDLLVPMFGTMGKRAKMDRVPPIQSGHRYQYRWLGVQAARNAAQVQQQIAMVNVVAKIPPQMYRNHRLDLTAMIENLVENAMGPRLAPLTFVSLRDELAMEPKEENELLAQGFQLPVNPMDDDKKHIMEHEPLLANDTSHAVKAHMMMHEQQRQAKAQAQQMQAQQQGGPGPRAGGQAGAPRGGQQPPGALHQDRMPGAGAMPIGATQ